MNAEKLQEAAEIETAQLDRRLRNDPEQADRVLVAVLSAALAHHIHRHGIDHTVMLTGNMLRDELARQEALSLMQAAGSA